MFRDSDLADKQTFIEYVKRHYFITNEMSIIVSLKTKHYRRSIICFLVYF